MGVYHGRPFRLADHLRRLERSVRELGLQRRPDPDQWRRAVEQTIQSNQVERARLRRAEQLGAEVLLYPSPELREGTVGLVVDPTGAVLALQKWPL